MKAYSVFPSDDSYDRGCLLIFAENRNKAKFIGLKNWPGYNEYFTYLDMTALRVPKMDKCPRHKMRECWIVETNEELPDGWTFFDDNI